MKSKQLLIVGNPNSGKTTLFNRLTGSRQEIGNWAGVTVDKKQGQLQLEGVSTTLTDLPGIYTLDNVDGENSLDESIAISALFNFPCDLIVNILDASSLERSLYLTLQLRELGRPMVVVLNKMDVVKAQGFELDIDKLSSLLKCPVLCVTATDMRSVENLKASLLSAIEQADEMEAVKLDYGAELESTIVNIADALMQDGGEYARANAIRLLCGDSALARQASPNALAVCEREVAVLHTMDTDLVIADVRYSHVADICRATKTQIVPLKARITDAIDDVVLNRYIGLPIFFAVMYLMFMFSINIGGAFIDFFDIGVGALLVDGGHYLLDDHLPVWLVTLIANGLGGGIQTVATFIPVIACLYLFMSLLEASGYMARAAFVLDKAMQRIGLPGKAFVPLVLGFGCNVPAIMATRTLDRERERRLAAAMAPFMSCGARLPVYALFAAAFFPENGQNVVFLLYLLGIAVAVFTGVVMRRTLYPGDSEALLMEMPRYEWPRVRDIWMKTWQKLKRFVLGAGKTIVVVVTVLSFVNSLGTDGSFGNEDSENSVLAKAAQLVTPVFSPIGIEEDNWPATVGIITGIFAKEAVVGTLNNLYASPASEEVTEYDLLGSLIEAVQTIPENLVGLNFADPLGIQVGDLPNKEAVAEEQEVDLSIFANLSANFTAASAFAYLVFVLLYTPCVAAMGAYVREFGKPFAVFIASWTMLLAVVVATLCYQAMMLAVTPVTSVSWMAGSIVLMAAAIALLKRQSLISNALRVIAV
ncbi:Fe(2+) transporter permease subunit FeoB [Grimontia hollisae]|uniref:Ferrous iron transport protein B n=2 Tax=Grimontia hollisae TaxID=673 RepID=D0IBR1_GRIHO|nr:Fe(2+) transporter permease subunit FeoB [Grimontia hollisae]AMG29708.1 Fe(2+) transporter permease subunit FeoB [Grimontia hollisae]EEY71329.1 ferrous iron transport protein B [Grimontia hollisae CIP 101886]STO43543.1 Ferrous iron transport protein B [Grimontia hollisae]STO56993.1 Ferrous iron transport protein B [Grimontia hollisae]STQ74855.1 Ferrous iron transport protein B [Grimontia hollisae]